MWNQPAQYGQISPQPQQDLGGSIANTIAYGGTNDGMFQTPSQPMSDFLGGTMYSGPDYGSIMGNAYMPGLGALTGTGEVRGNIYDPTGGRSNTIESALVSGNPYDPSAADPRAPGTLSGRVDNLFNINPNEPLSIGGGGSFGSGPGEGGYDGGLGQSGGFGGVGGGGGAPNPMSGIPGSPFGGGGGGGFGGQQPPGQGQQQPGANNYRRPQFGQGRWNDQAQMLAGNSGPNMPANMPGYTGAANQAGPQRQYEQQRNTFPTAGQPMSSMAGPGMGELAQRAMMGGQQPLGAPNPQQQGQVQLGGPGGMPNQQPPQLMQQPQQFDYQGFWGNTDPEELQRTMRERGTQMQPYQQPQAPRQVSNIQQQLAEKYTAPWFSGGRQ
jgi:hypothetical protein